MSITREQRDELAYLALRANQHTSGGEGRTRYGAFLTYLDSLVAEPAEQPKKSFEQLAHDAYRDAAFGTRRDQEGARLHADDARAAMAAFSSGYIAGCISSGKSWSPSEVLRQAILYGNDSADAMQAERNKRRQG